MKTILRTLLVLSALASAQIALAGALDGTWVMNIEMQGGTSNSTFTLTQKDEVITGNYKGQFGEAPVTGTIKGDDVVLTFRTETQGVPIEVTYIGTVDGNAMTGKVTVAGFGGTFKGARQR